MNWVHARRCTVLVVGFAVLFGVPFAVQLLGRNPKLGWHWKLYSGHGMGVCEGHFSDATTGELVPIVRHELLDARGGYRDRYQPRLNKSALPSQAYSVCRQIRSTHDGTAAEQLDVRLVARCSERLGWVEVADGTYDVCAREGRHRLSEAIATAPDRARRDLHDPWRHLRRWGRGL